MTVASTVPQIMHRKFTTRPAQNQHNKRKTILYGKHIEPNWYCSPKNGSTDSEEAVVSPVSYGPRNSQPPSERCKMRKVHAPSISKRLSRSRTPKT